MLGNIQLYYDDNLTKQGKALYFPSTNSQSVMLYNTLKKPVNHDNYTLEYEKNL